MLKRKKKISGEVKLILKRLKFRCIVVCGQKVEYFRSNNQPGNLQRQVKTYRFPRNYFSFERSLPLPLLLSDGNRGLIHFPAQTRHRFSTRTINTVALTDP